MRYPDAKDHNLPLNPWLSLWTRPRATMRQILKINPAYGGARIIAAYGIVNLLQAMERSGLADTALKDANLLAFLMIAAFFGPPLFVLGLYISGWLLEWAGKKMGGRATRRELRIACLWSHVPLAAGGALYGPRLWAHGKNLFSTSDNYTIPLEHLGLEYANIAVAILMSVWTTILLSHMIAEVQGYRSAWRGLWNLLLPGLYIMGLGLILALLIAILKPA